MTSGAGKRSKRSPGRRFTPAQLAERAAALPVVSYPDLPVSAHREEIAQALESHQVIIVSGETGSGKTTQLPKICLELGRGVSGMIGHTQPRRLAARAVAERIASELDTQVGRAPGDVVGYQVRFTDEVGPTTLVKLMTDGILLAELGQDPTLSRYDTIIVDEAHERSLNIDFIIGYLSRLLPKRPDLKVIITSATIDSQRFAEHFSQALGTEVPIIEVSGRAYPVEVRYRPLLADVAAPDATMNEDEQAPLGTFLHPEVGGGELAELGYGLGEELDLETALVEAVDELLDQSASDGGEAGDILVFLPGERDIVDATTALREHLGKRYVSDPKKPHPPNGVEVVPLFARLSAAEQHRIYAPHSLRRVVLATNIAETSLTVPGVRYVIDSGLARVSRFSNKTKVQRLPIEPISQASAGQRAGRAGRTSPGVAIRLYSETDFLKRDRFTEPEILRTSLAAVILQMKALGLGDVANFPFLDKPNPRAVRDGLALLTEIGALTATGKLTEIGRKLARLPIDPRLGRMLLEADKRGIASEVLVIVAALSIQDVRERPSEFQAQADQLHARYTDPRSDFITYLNLWRYLNVTNRELSGSAFRRMCRKEFFHYLRFREWRDIVRQLSQMAKQVGIKTRPLTLPSPSQIRKFEEEEHPQMAAVLHFGRGPGSVDVDEVHRAILPGLLSNLGSWDEAKREYVGTRQTRFTIWPGSGLRRRRPEWVMAAELVETSRLFARTVAAINPEWVEPVAKHLVTRNYSQPVWSRAKGAATVLEKVSLYGLTLIADRQTLLTSLGDRTLSAASTATTSTPTTGTSATGTSTSSTEGLTAKTLAREMFIHHALVKGEWRENYHAFSKHNQQIMAQAQDIADRMRDPSALPDEAVRYRFFDKRLPPNVTSSTTFNRWWKTARKENPSLLNYTLEELVGTHALADPHAFPTRWNQGDLELQVDYSFDPGSEQDGVTITIPLAVLPRVKPDGFDWLVPGLLEELCVAYIRGLPKAKRKLLAPAPQTGQQVHELLTQDPTDQTDTEPSLTGKTTDANETEEHDPYSLAASLDRLRSWAGSTGKLPRDAAPKNSPEKTQPPQPTGDQLSFQTAFQQKISQLKGVALTPTDLAQAADSLPPHLRVSFRVIDTEGNILGIHDSLESLQNQLAKRSSHAVNTAVKDALKQAKTPQPGPATTTTTTTTTSPLTAGQWGDEPLPKQVEGTDASGLTLRGYPALTLQKGPKGKSIREVAVFGSLDEAKREHQKTLEIITYEDLALPQDRVTSRWSGKEALLLAASPYPNTAKLVEGAQRAALAGLLEEWDAKSNLSTVRSEPQYQDLIAALREQLEDRVHQVLQTVIRSVEAYAELEETMVKYQGGAAEQVRRQVRNHAKELFTDGFLTTMSPRVLSNVPRYLRAGTVRLDKATESAAALRTDQNKYEELMSVEQALDRAQERIDARPYSLAATQAIGKSRWLLEELRVSLFAQTLGTQAKVSPQRLLRQIDTLEQTS